MSQSADILKHLQEGKTINQLEALNLYGCFRLAARIADLKKHYTIATETITKDGKQFACYRLVA